MNISANGYTDAYKNRSFLRRLLREKSCQIAALGSQYVPICARIAYGFHLCIARRSSAPLSRFSAEKNPSYEYYVRMPRLSAHGINFSNESWGPLARPLAYQVARNSRVLANNCRPWYGGISSERNIGGAKVVRLFRSPSRARCDRLRRNTPPPLECPRILMISLEAMI